MGWTHLVNLSQSHAKTWSAEVTESPGRGYTGRIHYGKIGGHGRFHQYSSSEIVARKYTEKINEGYVRLRTDAGIISRYNPPLNMRLIIRGLISSDFPGDTQNIINLLAHHRIPGYTRERLAGMAEEISSSFRAEITRNGSTEKPREQSFSFRESSPESESEPDPNLTPQQTQINTTRNYETTQKGYIKKYHSTYRRPDYESIEVSLEYLRNLSPPQLEKFMQFFKTIPLQLRNNITEYGSANSTGTLRSSTGPTHIAVIRKERGAIRYIGFIGLFTNTEDISSFYVKSNESKRTTIVKLMLLKMAHTVNLRNGNSFRIPVNKVSDIMAKDIKKILNIPNLTFTQDRIIETINQSGTIDKPKRMINQW